MCALNLDAVSVASDVELEPAFLEPLVQKPEPVPVPEEKLDPITRPVEEHEQITGERVLPELIPDESAQSVVRFPKIDSRPAEKNPSRSGQAQQPGSSV